MDAFIGLIIVVGLVMLIASSRTPPPEVYYVPVMMPQPQPQESGCMGLLLIPVVLFGTMILFEVIR